MCITFFYINASSSTDQYRFVLISNRDEFYNRRTENAHFWNDYPTVIGGRDEESDSRGTWLAASTNGKIGVLLNISSISNDDHSNVESRGVLVSNYVTGNISPKEYIHEILNCKNIYNGYNLLLFDLMCLNSNVLVHTNAGQNQFQETTELQTGVYGISNSRLNTPYKKVVYGKQIFEDVLKKYNYVNQRHSLITKLLNLLKLKTKNYPDNVLYESKKYIMEENLCEKLSSIFVEIPEISYGTRTHSILLIDHNNMMDFNEFTMNDRNDPENGVWIHRNFKVHLQKLE